MKAPNESSPIGATFATIQIPAGAVVVAPSPRLFGVACASYLGMTEAQARRTLREMAADPSHGVAVVVLSRRPLEHAAPPDDVLRFLRSRRSHVEMTEAAPANDDAADPDSPEAVRLEMGLPQKPIARKAGAR